MESEVYPVKCNDPQCRRVTGVRMTPDIVAAGRGVYTCPGCNTEKGFDLNDREAGLVPPPYEGEPVDARSFPVQKLN